MKSLPNYLQSQRKRFSLSQEEVGFLLGIASVKFEFGSDKLAGPAFAAAFGKEFAESFAGYVVAGNFSTNLGDFVRHNPQILNTILNFRETQAGIRLRREILSHLAVSSGGEVAASVNAGLASVLPIRVIEDARTNFARLSVADASARYPALWHDANYGDIALALWKKKALAEFEETRKKLGLSSSGQCPCGSGEKIKFCCGHSGHSLTQ